MGVLQAVNLKTLLVLRKKETDASIEDTRISRVLDLIEPGPDCVHGTIYDKEKLRIENLRALILSDWSGCSDGVSILSNARRRQPKLPILVVGSEDADSRIAAYEAGADDYAIASCSDRELCAHLRGMLRRCDPVEDAVTIADLKVWIGPRVAFRSGKPIKLSNKEMELLLFLVSERSKPVSRADILKNVFGMAHDPGTNIVEVHIHRLRHKIDAGTSSKLLKTIRGVGYILDGDSTDLSPATAAAATGESCVI